MNKYIEFIKKQLNEYWDTEEIDVDLANAIANHSARLLMIVEQYEKAIKECIDRMNEGGAGTRSFVYEKLKEVMGRTE